MILIKDVLVHLDLLQEQFLCNLNACKGACCWEGELGAPLETDELAILDSIFDEVKPYLRQEGIQAIEQEGKYVEVEEGEYCTTLINNGACAYMTYDAKGVAKCGIEQAYLDGKIDFKKPISCHLYPIRINAMPSGIDALNYDRWDICSAACELGKQNQLPIYRFVREALERKYGTEFYEELDEVATDFLQSQNLL